MSDKTNEELFEEWQCETKSLDCFTPLKEAWLAACEIKDKEIEKLKDFWKPIMDKFETKYPNAGNANTIALTALTESFDIHCENEKLKAERDGARSSYEKLCESFDDLNVQNNYHANQMIKLQAERKEMAEALIEFSERVEDIKMEDEHLPECSFNNFGYEYICKCMDRYYFNKDDVLDRAFRLNIKHAPLIEKLKQLENNNDRD